MPVSTLQYYFGSRQDLLVAAFRHASGTEIARAGGRDRGAGRPVAALGHVVASAVTGYQAGRTGSGRLWIESWHFGIRDAEMRADAVRDYGAWRASPPARWQGRAAGLFAPQQPESSRGAHDRAGRRGRHPARARRPGVTADGAVAGCARRDRGLERAGSRG